MIPDYFLHCEYFKFWIISLRDYSSRLNVKVRVQLYLELNVPAEHGWLVVRNCSSETCTTSTLSPSSANREPFELSVGERRPNVSNFHQRKNNLLTVLLALRPGHNKRSNEVDSTLPIEQRECERESTQTKRREP